MSPAPLIDYIVNAVWQVPLIAVGAAVLTRFGRLGPASRHRVWVGALVLAVVLPLLPAAEALTVNVAPVAATVSTSPAQAAPSEAQSAQVRLIPTSLAPVEPAEGAARGPSPMAAPASAMIRVPPIIIGESWARAIALAYAAVLLAGAIRLGLAFRAAGAIARRAAPSHLEPEVAEAMAVAARSRGVPPPPVRMSDEIRSPVVVGTRTPMILIPPAFSRLPPEEQRAALLHELAHVDRRDFAVNLACETLSLPICWHPVAWEIKAGARRSREAACDVIASGDFGSRDAYARRLISLAGALRLTDDSDTSPAFVALISKSDLEDRLMQLIKGPRTPSKLRLLTASAAAALALAPAVVLHVTPAFARDATTSVSTPRAVPSSQAAPTVAPAARLAAPAEPAVASVAPRVAEAAAAAPVSAGVVAATPAMSVVAPTLIAHRMVLAQADIPPAPPAPPAPPPAYDGVPPAPPAPPSPPSPPIPPDLDARIDAQVHDAMRRAMAEADRALNSAEVQKALAQAHNARNSEEFRKAMAEAHMDQDAVRRQVDQAMNSPEVRRALAEARSAGSVEVHQALEEAKRETIRALDEAEREVDQAAAERAAHGDHDQHRDQDHRDQP